MTSSNRDRAGVAGFPLPSVATPSMLAVLGALSALAAPTALCSALHAQKVSDGYVSSVEALPNASGPAMRFGRASVYFTGTKLVFQDGATTRILLSFTSKVFGSFVIGVDANTLLFGENSTGGVWLVPTGTSGTPKKLNTVKFNYSATLYRANEAILSAKTGGFPAKNNDVIAIDLTTGSLDTIAVLPGASGPVATDGFGNLYYATASNTFPTPRGKVDVLRFSPVQVDAARGTGHLGITDAALIYKGLDAGGAMALDDDHDVFLTDWMNGQIVEISDVLSATPKMSVLASYSSATVASSLQFVPGNRWNYVVQEFEPFQPTGGGSLIVFESAFGSTSQLRTIQARRPDLAVLTPNPVPKASAFQLTVQNGPSTGTGFFMVGIGASPREIPVRLPFEHPVFWSAALFTPVVISPVPLNSKGGAALSLYNPGFAQPLVVTTQVYAVTQGNDAAGSSQPLELTLR